MKIRQLSIALTLLAGCCAACSESKTEKVDAEGIETQLTGKSQDVTTQILKVRDFNLELISNGKIKAKKIAELSFRTQETVMHIWVANGDKVTKGQKLAELDLFKLNNVLSQRKHAMEQANLELKDVLIGQGFAPDKTNDIPAETMRLAMIKSGYNQAKALYDEALYELEHATLVAPFDGVIANLNGKEHNLSNTAEPFCCVIGTQNMEVEFSVLESELPLLKKGDKVEISPYATGIGSRQGAVSEINPMVDANGMVKVKALVNGSQQLFEGMNVRVSVKRIVPNQLVLPKSAVALRAGKQVVFTLLDGRARWNYVHTTLENTEEYTISEGLSEGMEVIVTGVMNLAHETPVNVIN